jgi:hypothetical protein
MRVFESLTKKEEMGRTRSRSDSNFRSRKAFLLVIVVSLGIVSNAIAMGITAACFLGAKAVVNNGSWLIYWALMQLIVTSATFFVYYGFIDVPKWRYMAAMESSGGVVDKDDESIQAWIINFYNLSQRTEYWRTVSLMWIFNTISLLSGSVMIGFLMYGGGEFGDFFTMGDADVQIGPSGTHGIFDDRQMSYNMAIFVLSYLCAYTYAKFGFMTRTYFVNRMI